LPPTAISKNDPDAFHAISSLETEIGHAMRPNETLIQIVTRRLRAQNASEEQLCFELMPPE
jgi:hypothetical protein